MDFDFYPSDFDPSDFDFSDFDPFDLNLPTEFPSEEKTIFIDELIAIAYNLLFWNAYTTNNLYLVNSDESMRIAKMVYDLKTECFDEKQIPFPSEDSLFNYYCWFFQIDPDITSANKLLEKKKEPMSIQTFKENINNFTITTRRKHLMLAQTDLNWWRANLCVRITNYLNLSTTGCQVIYLPYGNRRSWGVFVKNEQTFRRYLQERNGRIERGNVKIRDFLIFCRWYDETKFTNLLLIPHPEYFYFFLKETEQEKLNFQQQNELKVYYSNNKTKLPNILKSYKIKVQNLNVNAWPKVEDINHLCCITCGLVDQGPLFACSDCKKAIYCSSDCQRKDWETNHCKECK